MYHIMLCLQCFYCAVYRAKCFIKWSYRRDNIKACIYGPCQSLFMCWKFLEWSDNSCLLDLMPPDNPRTVFNACLMGCWHCIGADLTRALAFSSYFAKCWDLECAVTATCQGMFHNVQQRDFDMCISCHLPSLWSCKCSSLEKEAGVQSSLTVIVMCLWHVNRGWPHDNLAVNEWHIFMFCCDVLC